MVVEIAGRPDLTIEPLMPLIGLKAGETLSISKIDAAITALKSTGSYEGVQVDIRPEQDGVRVMFVLQPACTSACTIFPARSDCLTRGSCKLPIIPRRNPTPLSKSRKSGVT